MCGLASLRQLRALHATRRTLLVAIDGAGGSGKSRLADDLRTRLTASHVPTSIVEVDDFFLPSRRRPRGPASEKPIGGDFDWQRLRQEVLEPLRRGQAARMPGRHLCAKPGGVVPLTDSGPSRSPER